MSDGLRSGVLAAAVGINVQTLRYYERRGLLEEPARTSGGHRMYPRETVTVLRVIKAAQRLGFTLDDVAELPPPRRGSHSSGRRSPTCTCGSWTWSLRAPQSSDGSCARERSAASGWATRQTDSDSSGSRGVLLRAPQRSDHAGMGPGGQPGADAAARLHRSTRLGMTMVSLRQPVSASAHRTLPDSARSRRANVPAGQSAVSLVHGRCPRWESNPHCDPFKGPASAGWATGAPGQRTVRPIRDGGATADRPQHDREATSGTSSPAATLAARSTCSSIGGVSRPVNVFCWLTW